MMLATTWSISRSGIASLVVVVVASLLFGKPMVGRSGVVRLGSSIVFSLMLVAVLWRGLDISPIASRHQTA